MHNTLILADIQNLYYTARQAYSRNVDYNALWRRATDGRKIVKAYAYAIDRGDPKQRQFQTILKAIGFELRLKPFIQREDGTAKGDWDVGITIDAIENAGQVNTVVLASGDGDFAYLVNRLKNAYQCHVEVYGVTPLTASSLINAADTFVPIEDGLLL